MTLNTCMPRFIEEDPGRQTMSGSFNPIDDGEWSEQVYVKPTQKLFAAIAAHDRDAAQKLIQEEIDVNQRDHVGRTSLHVAILSNAPEIACDLINAGARITARLADGRASLHLASQYDQVTVVRKLLEKSAQNAEESKVADAMDEDEDEDEDEATKKAAERPSSEDDWSSHDDEDVEMVEAEDENSDDGKEDSNDEDEGEDKDEDEEEDEGEAKSRNSPDATPVPETHSGDIPDDENDEPDIIEVNGLDWDFGFSALSYAILFGSLPVIEELLTADADVKLATKPESRDSLHPLSLTILREDEDEACKIAERLILAGATSTTANETMDTIFHAAVRSGREKLVATILRCDQHSHTVIDFPLVQYQNVTFPISTAIKQQHYAVLAVMLAHDAKLVLDEADITRVYEAT
jgi:ankyrin repeat protein